MIVNQYIKEYLKSYNNYKEYWNYEDGLILSGCVQMYKATGEEMYKEFILKYMDYFINEDGTINRFEKEKYNIDSINAGKVLFFLYTETKKEKYYKAIETLVDQLKDHPRTGCNNFWHKKIYPNQIWLDGLYMAQPFYMQYETEFNKKENYNDILNQFNNVRKYIFNEEKQLYYHAYDEAKVQLWADPVTGLSQNFWLRSMGWYLMALIDTIDVISDEIFEHYYRLRELFKEATKGILKYQDKQTKLFYQVIDKSEVEGNYTETSGSLMVAYSIMKACRLGILSREKYETIGEEIFDAVVKEKLITTDDKIYLKDICQVAGLGPNEERNGSVEYYLSEKIVCDDAKGVGPFMMAYAEKLMLVSN